METLHIRLLTSVGVALTLTISLLAQSIGSPEAQPGSIAGTVTDVKNDVLSGATVVLQGPAPGDRRTVVTNDNGFFQLQGVKAGVPYHVIIRAKGFADWTSPVVTLSPGQYKILNGKLQVEQLRTTVIVNPPLSAPEQVQAQLQQRIVGIIPNFYVSYDPNAKPLTPKLKFKLAFRVLVDPVTIAGVALIAGIGQAADYPDYGQGAEGYAKRFGSSYADGFTDIMVGGAILPSLLHQDPRYFYQGKGTKKSRALHALSFPFVCKGDNGKLQPNYSSIGGDLAASAVSYAYYPESNRSTGLIFRNVGISTAERAAASLLQEFVLAKITHKRK
jgi:hypothetical protein